jgi:hypothetical protein
MRSPASGVVFSIAVWAKPKRQQTPTRNNTSITTWNDLNIGFIEEILVVCDYRFTGLTTQSYRQCGHAVTAENEREIIDRDVTFYKHQNYWLRSSLPAVPAAVTA